MSSRFLLSCVFFLVACSATKLPESTGDINTASTVVDWSDFDLGPNDLVHFSLFGHPEFRSPDDGLRVAPNGTLSVALLGDVNVSGISVSEARQVIEAGLGKYYPSPSVTLSVIEYSSRRFYIFGEMETPGPMVMDRPITAMEALSMGGGFLPGAYRERVVIIRRHEGDEVEVISLDAKTPNADGLVQVRPGDMLFVGKSGTGVFSEQALPYMQGIGLTLGQIASLILILDRT
jgi:protein involved in polysaccharide export with SLBB domain